MVGVEVEVEQGAGGGGRVDDRLVTIWTRAGHEDEEPCFAQLPWSGNATADRLHARRARGGWIRIKDNAAQIQRLWTDQLAQLACCPCFHISYTTDKYLYLSLSTLMN